MKSILMTTLRNKDSSLEEFRSAAMRLGSTLAHNTLSEFTKKEISVITPLGETTGYCFDEPVMLMPILRAGLVLLPPFLTIFPHARVGIIGLKRNETTAIADMYYENLPELTPDENVIILDPMLATGGSALKALHLLEEKGVNPSKIKMVCMIASTEGLKTVKSQFPQLDLIVAQEDLELTKEKFIYPGLGDFGDRFFGTEYTY
ncbi:MAG: Uracil phosphoribosyltransferase [Chlamydiae bacterium]|nr:Uracil phosphoribosyltransferase [Chlamydiota bacterium]